VCGGIYGVCSCVLLICSLRHARLLINFQTIAMLSKNSWYHRSRLGTSFICQKLKRGGDSLQYSTVVSTGQKRFMTLHVHGCCKINVDCWVHYGSYDTCSVCLDESFLGEWRVVGGRYVGGKRKVCVQGMFMLCKVQLWWYHDVRR